MGRAGETVRRTFPARGAMQIEPGRRTTALHDNDRVLRYLAKLTINPALAHGLAHEVGSLEAGRHRRHRALAPDHFGAKPQLVLKAGFPAWGVTGDPNATIDSCEPLVLGPQFGGHGAAPPPAVGAVHQRLGG